MNKIIFKKTIVALCCVVRGNNIYLHRCEITKKKKKTQSCQYYKYTVRQTLKISDEKSHVRDYLGELSKTYNERQNGGESPPHYLGRRLQRRADEGTSDRPPTESSESRAKHTRAILSRLIVLRSLIEMKPTEPKWSDRTCAAYT